MEKNETQITQDNESIIRNGVSYTIAKIPRTNKTYYVRCLKPSQMEDLAKLIVPGSDSVSEAVLKDLKIASKAAAIYLLPGFWKRKLMYWLLWRWFYYIKEYDCDQLQPILSAGNGSTPYIDFLRCMSHLVNQKDTQMRMTRGEAEKVMQELAMRAEGKHGGKVE